MRIMAQHACECVSLANIFTQDEMIIKFMFDCLFLAVKCPRDASLYGRVKTNAQSMRIVSRELFKSMEIILNGKNRKTTQSSSY